MSKNNVVEEYKRNMGSVFNKKEKVGVAKSKLTDKQRVYIAEYLANGCDGYRAARAAGCSIQSANNQSAKWNKHPLVAKALRKAGTDLMDSKREKAIQVVEQLFRLLQFNLMSVARRSKHGYLEVDEEVYEEITPIIGDCVTEVEFKTIEMPDGSSHTVFRLRLMSKDRALELAMKYCELLTDKQEHTFKTAIDWSKLYEPSNGEANVVEGMIEEASKRLPPPSQ